MSDHDLRRRVEQCYSIPPLLWRTVCQRSNGFFGCESVYDDRSVLKGHNTWFRFQIKQLCDGPHAYVWYDLTFFTVWNSLGFQGVLCFDIHPAFQDQIYDVLMHYCSHSLQGQAYQLHPAFVAHVLELFDHSVWTLRDRVRDIEKRRMDKTEPETDYPLLHEIARHVCHSSETLSVAIDTTSSMRTQCGLLERESSRDTSAPCVRVRQRLDFLQQLLNGLHARSVAVEARLKNELNLAINLVAQQETAATVRISKAARSDGAAMRAVAVITLLFLPSTFVSTIFSMTFFSFSPGGPGERQSWVVSDKIWIYWLFTVPLTIVALLTWLWWQRRYS